jgi:maltose alpha-D-glucosyltransferase/alpha-amylase
LVKTLPAPAQAEAQKVLDSYDPIRSRFRLIPERKISSLRIRVHDDLQLSKVLHTGKDFVFIGFDGRADRALSERRIKRSPLRDVASMLLSFQYAAYAVLFHQVPGVTYRPETMAAIEFWSGYWRDWFSASFLKGYFDAIGQNSILPANENHIRLLVDAFSIERALEEVGRELNDRPEWVRIPLGMLLRVLESPLP